MKQRFSRDIFSHPFTRLLSHGGPLWLLAAFLSQGVWQAPLRAQATEASIGPAMDSIPGVNRGELLVGELNCVACHQANAAVQARLFSRQSPHLGATGLRLTPKYLRAFLGNPLAEQPGTTMPDLLHGMDNSQKTATVDALVHFLWSFNTNAAVAVSANQTQVLQGRLLYHQIGCVACHAPQEAAHSLNSKSAGAGESPVASSGELFNQAALEHASVPLGNLARKTTVQELARFLIDPLKARPSGRMPSLNLGQGEATAIAMYLLREQSAATNASRPVNKSQGLDYQYFEGDFSDTAALDHAKPVASGTVEQFSLSPRKGTDNIGLRFSGFLTIPADGNYTFYTSSDDGSRLFLDGQPVVENDGTHGTIEKKGVIPLAAGDHPILVSYFNGGGEATLKVSFQGPGLPKQEIPAAALSHMGLPMLPLDEENLVVNPEKALRGRELFGSLGCAACHQIGSTVIASTLRAKPLANLDLKGADNCLNTTQQRAPKYQLSETQRGAIRSTLASQGELARPLAPKEQVARTMAALNCLACHFRDAIGGPAASRSDYFTILGEADLGDEGRLPPHLTRVGDKLRPEWLREVLLNKGTARPYLATRMPQFGQVNLGPLVAGFAKADSSGTTEPVPETSLHDANYGRKLVGTEGLSCIACHVFGGHKSLGIPAMDLTFMTRRLKKDWFNRYLLDPASLRPGTRMPAFWPEGKSARKDILDGDTGRQIGAIWAYLSRGKEAGLPPGLIQGKMELVATNEALIYRNFIQGAGSRGIGVAYPEKANLAFDANELRLAVIWQGPFIDAARHRTGRGEGFEGPLGYNSVTMPAGIPFAILSDAGGKWPAGPSRKAGYRMRGYQLDGKRRPTFLYSFENIRVEDFPVAVSGDLDASLRRTLTLQADQPVEKLWFRAWAGTKIEAQNDGSFLADGKIRLQFQLADAAKAIVRQSDGQSELLVPVIFNGAKAKIVEDLIW